jgi:hypothetical protein
MPHYVHPKIDGDWISLEFSCTEPEGADCRLVCPPDEAYKYGCESVTIERDEDGTPWHVGYRFDEATGKEVDSRLHRMVPADRCLILDWDNLDESYCGEPGPLREGEIVFRWWSEEWPEWEYTTEAAS